MDNRKIRNNLDISRRENTLKGTQTPYQVICFTMGILGL